MLAVLRSALSEGGLPPELAELLVPGIVVLAVLVGSGFLVLLLRFLRGRASS